MNNKIVLEKYRKLSISALVTGILADSLSVLYFFGVPFRNFLQNVIGETASTYNILIYRSIMGLFVPVVLGLSITAVVHGSIDLKRIKAGRHGNKGRGFDIAGIVMGGIFILFVLIFLILEIIFPH